jgi:hypothetical protein
MEINSIYFNVCYRKVKIYLMRWICLKIEIFKGNKSKLNKGK